MSEPTPPDLKAVIFDFDGTILDTEYLEYASWQDVFQSYGLELSMDWWVAGIGKRGADIPVSPYELLESQMGRPVDRDVVRHNRYASFRKKLADERVLPGVLDLMNAVSAAGLSLALASNSDRKWVISHMSRHVQESRFHAMTFRDEVANGKPHPEIYLTVLDALKVRTEQAVAIEDSPTGVAAARGADLFCVAVPNRLTRGLTFDQADWIVESLADVTLSELRERVAHPSRDRRVP